MDEKAIAKEATRSTAEVHEIEQTDSELYKLGMYTAAALTGIVGVWGLICLSSSFLNNGGPVEMVKNLFSAITGM